MFIGAMCSLLLLASFDDPPADVGLTVTLDVINWKATKSPTDELKTKTKPTLSVEVAAVVGKQFSTKFTVGSKVIHFSGFILETREKKLIGEFAFNDQKGEAADAFNVDGFQICIELALGQSQFVAGRSSDTEGREYRVKITKKEP